MAISKSNTLKHIKFNHWVAAHGVSATRNFDKDMPRLIFTCAYDGTAWRGWQSQAGGMTLQDVIEDAFAGILRTRIRINASGRTDAGVHAIAQVFHADVPETCRMTPQNWRAALNAHLDGTIRIMEVRPAESDFHARFSAKGKIYEYLISTAPVLSPFMMNRAWHCPHGIDVKKLAEALACYQGEHDFRRFAAKRGNEPEPAPADYYIRHIYSAEVEEAEQGSLLRLRFYGNGFMYRMVRMLTGAAVKVACGKMSIAELQHLLSVPDGPKNRHCAPAEGLYLKQVFY